MIEFIKFDNIGTFKYFEEYEINRKGNYIEKYYAFIKEYKDNIKNITIFSRRINKKNNSLNYFNTSISADILVGKFQDGKTIYKRIRYITNSINILSINDVLYTLENCYDSSFHPVTKQINYNMSDNKTDQDYNVSLGSINDNNGKKYDINININKENVVEYYKRDFTIKKIKDISELNDIKEKYNTELVPVELYSVVDQGYVCFKDKNIDHYFINKDNSFSSLKMTDYKYPFTNNILLEIMQRMYNHQKYELYNSNNELVESYNIKYDDWGLVESIDTEKYPVVKKDYYSEYNDKLEAIYSLHPLHFDYNNFNIKYTDNCYCQDSLELTNVIDDNIVFSRHIKQLSKDDINYIKNLSNKSYILYNKDINSIVSENKK